jgi:hypothetical protein
MDEVQNIHDFAEEILSAHAKQPTKSKECAWFADDKKKTGFSLKVSQM